MGNTCPEHHPAKNKAVNALELFPHSILYTEIFDSLSNILIIAYLMSNVSWISPPLEDGNNSLLFLHRGSPPDDSTSMVSDR